MVSHVCLLNLQDGSQLCLVAVISLEWVHNQHVVHLGTIELSLLFVVLQVSWHNRCLLYLDTAFLHAAVLIQLSQDTLDHVIAALIFLHVFHVAVLLLVGIYLTLYHLISHVYGVIRNLILSRETYCEFWCQRNVKLESEIICCSKVHWFLLLAWEWLTQHVHVVLADILENLILE